MEATEIPLIDSGTAPEFYADGLFRVEAKGAVARFVLYATRVRPDGSNFREIVFSCILPTEAVGPAISLTLQSLGPGIIVPAVTAVARHMLLH